MNSKISVFIIVLLFFQGCFGGSPASAKTETSGHKKIKYVKSKHGLGTLMKISGDRGKMIRELNKDTKCFEKISKAIKDSNIKVGVAAKDIRKKYGDPVVVVQEDSSESSTRWVYKPGTGSFFEGKKACLVFNKEDCLERFSIVDDEK